MKKLILTILLCGFTSCTTDFASINTDPNIISTPDVRFLFADVQKAMNESKYLEFFYDNARYLPLWAQQYARSGGNGREFNTIEIEGGRYGRLYQSFLPNLFEIRRQIDRMPDAERQRFRNMRAVTYVLQIQLTMPVSDIFGSMPYREAMRGRYEGNYSPKFDTQSEQYTAWLSELDSTIAILLQPAPMAAATGQTLQDYGNADGFYNNDWRKWAKAANVLKLRIAARLARADATRARTVITQVLASPAGLFESAADEWSITYGASVRSSNGDWFFARPAAAKNFIDFLKRSNDPRLGIFFAPNSYTDEALAAFRTANRALPASIRPDQDSLYRYNGIPVSPDAVLTGTAGAPFAQEIRIGSVSYLAQSTPNYRFFAPDDPGIVKEVIISYAEQCLLLAEFAELGLATGGASADVWYERGVRASLAMYDDLAEKGKLYDKDVATFKLKASADITPAKIDAYVRHPNVVLGGSRADRLEKISLQLYTHYYRWATEVFTQARRTGFPRRNSTLLAWETPIAGGEELLIPRRYALREPLEQIRAEWAKAQDEQGFTKNVATPEVLNRQRLWWDKASPAWGGGGQ